MNPIGALSFLEIAFYALLVGLFTVLALVLAFVIFVSMIAAVEWVKTMKVNLVFAWYDFWVGFFWDSKKRILYFFPLPMIGVVFTFPPKKEKGGLQG